MGWVYGVFVMYVVCMCVCVVNGNVCVFMWVGDGVYVFLYVKWCGVQKLICNRLHWLFGVQRLFGCMCLVCFRSHWNWWRLHWLAVFISCIFLWQCSGVFWMFKWMCARMEKSQYWLISFVSIFVYETAVQWGTGNCPSPLQYDLGVSIIKGVKLLCKSACLDSVCSDVWCMQYGFSIFCVAMQGSDIKTCYTLVCVFNVFAAQILQADGELDNSSHHAYGHT